MINLDGLKEALENEKFVTQLADTTVFDINSIYPNPHQPRFNEDVEGLKASIVAAYEDMKKEDENIKPEDGLLEPIIISPKDNGQGYICVGGHRRLKACKELGHETIKANCIKLNERQRLSFSIVENLQRENLTALETAIAIDKAIATNLFASETELANDLGKPQAFISKCKSVLKLPKTILDDLHKDKSKIGLEILVDLQRVKDENTKLDLYNRYKKGEIKLSDIREVIKKEKNKKDTIKPNFIIKHKSIKLDLNLEKYDLAEIEALEKDIINFFKKVKKDK
ncbi:ParB/RepB/Spo0J family partition protein [Aliarcobacter butzleri]|uniref:ParB/RepB/Spo0J family partition protein n=1 Tax=Aliarcobacter butzleri TaxID=28197 RepID=UPI0021B5475B|nr:ParB/RepB/Spo0J family partition protein [Aliarcobacter butzleri]MCT7643870.1 ParB/RepB/Spo0J family partition protein [Aliarcobacter butzleri]